MANHSHLQLQLVKTKKGTYVSRWVDPTTGKKGPVVPTYTPSAQAYSNPQAQQVHDNILLYGNAGGKDELDKLSLAGLPAQDVRKLQKLKKQALEHIEGEQEKAQELITAQKQVAPKPAVGMTPPKPAAAKPELKPLSYAKTSDPAHFNDQAAAVATAAAAGDTAKLQALHKHHYQQLAEHFKQAAEPTLQQSHDAAAHEDIALLASHALKQPKPAAPAKAAGFEPKTKFENSPWMFNAAKYLISLTNAGDVAKLAAQKVPKNTHKADKAAFLAIQAEGLAYLGAPAPAAKPAKPAKIQAAGTPAAPAGSFKAPVDTAKWPAHNSAAVGAAKKVALIEQLANAGDLVSLKAMTLPHNNAGQNSYGKGVNKAHQAALAHLSGDAPAQAAQAAATAPWKPEAPAAEVKAAVATLAPIKALPEPLQGPGIVVGNLCRDEKGHFIPCSLPGAKPVTHGELGEAFTIGIDTQKWKQGHPSVVQTQKKFAALEALVAAGDLAGLEAIAPKLGPNPNNYQKAMAAGHALALAYLQAKQSAGQVALATTPEAPVPVPGPQAPVSLKHEAAPTAPHGIDTWKKVGGQLGSNPGAQLVDPAGQKHYVKYSKSNDHARNEVLAARLLELTGTGVVPYTLVTTKPGVLGTATKWTDTTSLPLTPGSAGLAAAQLDFATHAWLANWDVVGLGHDNLQLGPDGQPLCVDTGGALLYRAQGEPKGADFKATCPEWDTMRSISHNSPCAAVFGSMTGAQLVASVEKLEQLDTKLILDAVLTHGPGTKKDRELLAAKLLQRRDYLIGKKNALLATDPTAAASVSAPKPTEPAFNKPAPAAEAPAPTPVAPAFPPTLTEAQLSSKTNPINKKLWGKKVAIDQAVAGFASGQLTAQQALEALNGPDMTFGVQCYQVKVGKYHADVVAAMQQAAVGAVAAPPAAAGTPAEPFSEAWYQQQKPAAGGQGPVAAALSPAAQALAAGKAKAAAMADPTTTSDTHAQQAKMLAFPAAPGQQTLSYADKDALGEMNATAVMFKSGKISAQAAYDALNEHGGFNSDELNVYHSKLTDTLENYLTMGTSYAEAKAEYSLAWSGLPGHRKHATPEGPTVPTHLAAPAPAPAAKAPTFVPPTYLTAAQKKALGADKLAQYESVEWMLSKVGHGEWTPATAAKEIGALPYLKSGTLTKWKSQAIDALINHQAVSQSAPGPAPTASFTDSVPVPLPTPAPTPAPAKAPAGPFSTQGNFVPPTPPTKAELAGWNKPIQTKFKDAMRIVKQADTGMIGWLLAHNTLESMVGTTAVPELQEYLYGAIQELKYAMDGAPKKAEKKPPTFDPTKLSKPVNFLQWGDTGAPGPSSSLHYNTANNNAARLLYKTAQAGDLSKLKALKVMVPDKDTGKNIGSELALSHPSKWVKGYAEQLVNEIDEQLHPPKEIRIDPQNPLSSLSKSLPELKGALAKSASKVGKYLLLGSAAGGFKVGGTMKSSQQIVPEKIVFPNPGPGAKPFTTYAKQTMAAWAKMPAQQKAAIKSFTAGGYTAMVESFWNNNPSGKALAAHEAIMTLGHEIKPGTLLSRGLDLSPEIIGQLKKGLGTVIQEPAVTSTAINPSVWAHKNTQLKITVGPGVKGLYVGAGSLGDNYEEISSSSGEFEMMLPGGYRLLVTGVDENVTTKDADGFGSWNGSKRTIVHCVLLPNIPGA